MNILPKKSWHVRTRANIEKVRRDEANAAEEEKIRLKKVALAEQEARTGLLRARAQQKRVHNSTTAVCAEEVITEDDSKPLAVVSAEEELRQHVNFFRDAEQGKSTAGVNKEHEEEKKADQEKYEKRIGLLTYLGQSSAESQTVKPWYLTSKKNTEDQTTDLKRKNNLDPMHSMNHYLNMKRKKDHPEAKHQLMQQRPVISHSSQNTTSSKLEYTAPNKPKTHKQKHKHKKEHRHKKHSCKEKHSHKERIKDRQKRLPQMTSPSQPSIEQLRAERLRREAVEKARTDRLLSGKQDIPKSDAVVSEEPDGRYNSQFHPELARKHRHKKDFAF